MNLNVKNNISILVPCYNVDFFLDRFFKSLMKQNLKDISLIFCDDFSTDKTFFKLLQFQRNNPNLDIKILKNLSNLGLAETRNKLISEVKTSHFYFIDPDDTLINKDAFSEFKDLIEMYPETDIFVSKGKVRLEISKLNFALKHFSFDNPLLNNVELKRSGFIDPKRYISQNHPFAWNVLVKTSFYRSLNVNYLKNHVMEDFSVGYYMFFMSNKCYFINKYNYMYHCRPNSITFTVNFKKINDLAVNIEYLYSLLESKNLLNDFIYDHKVENTFMKRVIFGLTYKNLYGKHVKHAKYYAEYFDKMEKVLDNWGIVKRLMLEKDKSIFAKSLKKYLKISDRVLNLTSEVNESENTNFSYIKR